jgi:membrane-associated protein
MHFDLESLIRTVGYLGVAGIVFAESGLLIGFFLPGDSLLFTAGFLASQGYLDIHLLAVLCAVAAILGDNFGYEFGKRAGKRLFKRPDSRYFKQEYLQRAKLFYEQHGNKTVVLARFTPIVRTFAPIVAGATHMNRQSFVRYNIIGGVIWGAGITYLGYGLGSKIPNIDKILLPVVLGVIVLSIGLPGAVHFALEFRTKRKQKREEKTKES